MGTLPMITFLTLFLSLVRGIHPVQVAVDGPVARVEIVLDERRVTTLGKPPWTAPCDFGPLLAPHELLAVAYDADGNHLQVARQLVNLPRSPAEAGIALDRDETGEPVRARVFWESADPVEPRAVAVTFDGQVLEPDPDGAYPLPEHDSAVAHMVSAQVDLGDGVEAQADITYGGRYGVRVATELTAVPIVLGRGVPSLEELAGTLVDRGQELTPVAVDRPGARIYLVRDDGASSGLPAAGKEAHGVGGGEGRRAARRALSPREDGLLEVRAYPIMRKDRELFPTSSGVSLEHSDLARLVAGPATDEAAGPRQRLADAVAVAGVQAAGRAAPRAVILLLSSRVQDASDFRPAEVRRYLESVRVPLYVWTTAGGSSQGWGTAVDVGGRRGLRRAARELMRDIGRQRVVWVRGAHMINRIELAPGDRGFTLAGAPPAPRPD